jgi:REP element-mobilizing transposase RayT
VVVESIFTHYSKYVSQAKIEVNVLSLQLKTNITIFTKYLILAFIMTSGYHIKNQYAIHFVTFTIVGWVDVFTRKETKNIIIDAFKYCIENKGLKIYGYVIMSNHIHAMIQASEDVSTLSDLIRDFKKHTPKEIIKWMNESNKESRKE